MTTPIRASDTEREEVAGRLTEATGAGRLSTAEAEQRLTAVYAATFRHELTPLTADLPAPAMRATRLSMRTRPVAVHAGIAALAATLLIVRWVAVGGVFFWPAGPIIWLAVSVLVHLRVRRMRAGWSPVTRNVHI